MSVGRPSNNAKVRELIALLGALTEAGDTISQDGIAERMGISRSEAHQLLDLLLTAGDSEGSYLSLVLSDDESEATLAFDGGIKGRPLRLTLTETHAVLAALNACGIPEDDPLRQRIAQDFGRQHVTQESIEKQLEPLASVREHDTLRLISSALIQGKALRFRYQGNKDSEAKLRHAVPHRLMQQEGSWYIEALDADKLQERTFKIERMEEPALIEVPASAKGLPHAAEGEEARVVTLRFFDPRYLSLFVWPGLKIRKADAHPIEGAIPYYGTLWLSRQIAGCGGKVLCDDEEVSEKAQHYAKELLEELSRS